MNDSKILETVERYIQGEMNPDERMQFENLRKTNGEVDQLVVEHTLFLQQMNRFGEWQKFRTTLSEVHTDLSENGKIEAGRLKGKAKVVYLWNRYRRVAAIAASIAGIVALTITSLFNTLRPPVTDASTKTDLVKVINDIKDVRKEQEKLNDKIDRATDPAITQPSVNMTVRFNGTGFLIDPKGLMITNAHIVKNSRNIYVQNNKGDQFKAIVLKLDVLRDVAIIKIDDEQFKAFASLPYGIGKMNADIGEPIFTLGFPRNEIVYGEGYMSAKTGYNGDSLSCQIAVAANPGNSGGPVFNKDGVVIGILSAKQSDAEGAVFAIQSQYIYKALEELKKNPLYTNVKMSPRSSLAGKDKVQQVKKLQDYVFMVKAD